MNGLRPAPSLDQLLDTQRCLIRRAQLLTAGVTDATLRWQLERGRWQRILPGVYAAFAGRLDDSQRLVAAMLHGGAGSQVTGAAALRWHGFRSAPAGDRVHLLVPHRSKVTSAGFVHVQRTRRPDPLSRIRPGLEVCSVPRSVADAARSSRDLSTVRAFVAEAVQRRKTTVAELFVELDSGPVKGSALFRTALAEIAAGARSAPEAEFRSVLARSDVLPAIRWNPRLIAADGARLPSPDGWIAEVGIALEVDSREYHLTPDGWQRTMDRHNTMATHGALVLHFTPSQIGTSPATVLAAVEQAYLERAKSVSQFTAIRERPTA